MIGIKKIEAGRMGNRLLQYHFLRQIAKKTEVDYFYPGSPDSKYFEDMEKRGKCPSFFKKKIQLSASDIVKHAADDFVGLVKNYNNKNIDIVFNPPLLGEVFFDYLFYAPSDFLKIKSEFKKPFDFDINGKIIIGLHFRGTDFKQWNQNAYLTSDYYIKAINYCLEHFDNTKVVFALFTDDMVFSAYTETLSFLRSRNTIIVEGDSSRPAIHDFYQLSICDVIVSSPSTFAIMAGTIGKENKKIIHAKSWIDYAVAQNDVFWCKLKNTKNHYYSLWQIL